MNWRLENKKDYHKNLLEMWEDWSFPPLPLECLPERIYVAYEGDVDLYAIPVFITDSDFVLIGFPTGNKKAPKELKEGAFKYIVDIICTTMKYQGYTRVLTMSMNPKLMSEFESMNFTVADEGTNFYIKII